MSLLSRVRSWIQGAEGAARETPVPGSGESTAADDAPIHAPAGTPEEAEARRTAGEIARLARVGTADGPSADEAIALLRRVRGTVLEAAAVEVALRGFGERSLPEAVRVACADILAARGDEQGALRVLAGISSTPGLILAADLYASSGQLARAVGTIERVLARDIDAPGARERHQRWSASLGYVRRPARRLDEATVVAPLQATGAPFRLLREVARGGAGAVYEAEDERSRSRFTTTEARPGPRSSARRARRRRSRGRGSCGSSTRIPRRGGSRSSGSRAARCATCCAPAATRPSCPWAAGRARSPARSPGSTRRA
jgi:eukaryotic-like serine/threonine-protein kinase